MIFARVRAENTRPSVRIVSVRRSAPGVAACRSCAGSIDVADVTGHEQLSGGGTPWQGVGERDHAAQTVAGGQPERSGEQPGLLAECTDS